MRKEAYTSAELMLELAVEVSEELILTVGGRKMIVSEAESSLISGKLSPCLVIILLLESIFLTLLSFDIYLFGLIINMCFLILNLLLTKIFVL